LDDRSRPVKKDTTSVVVKHEARLIAKVYMLKEKELILMNSLLLALAAQEG
jgi:hypothetical protein